ncbi:Zn 2cys6 transcription factor [Apiospora arundinis]|uniref:Zn 2cys6 transcription factor n=1 Tax=Apiospora arundinis TaxID=335852 RepID=A0ABR2I802_9PEZI
MEPPRSLLALSALGCLSLWGVAWLNGTLEALFLAQETGQFPDGRSLRKVYTGYHAVDDSLVPVIAFFDVVTNAQSLAPRWLFFYVCGTIAAVDTWVLIESRRRGVRNFFLRHTITFIFLWNAAGAAFVAPIYLYMIAQSQHTKRDPTIPLNEARGFPPTLVANALFPLILFWPVWRGWDIHDHHGYLAFYTITPLLMILVLVAFTRQGTTLSTFETPKDPARPNEDVAWVAGSFYATGMLSALLHVGTVSMALLGGAPDLSLRRLVWPDPWKVTEAPPGSYQALLEGCHLFTQFDILISGAAIFVFARHMLNASSPALARERGMRETVWMVLGSILLGPAAAGSFALSVREGRLRDSVQTDSKKRGSSRYK